MVLSPGQRSERAVFLSSATEMSEKKFWIAKFPSHRFKFIAADRRDHVEIFVFLPYQHIEEINFEEINAILVKKIRKFVFTKILFQNGVR